MQQYNINNWYWLVAGNTTQAYSSASASYVALTDATYLAWLAAGYTATKISADDILKIRIDILESSATPRRVREAIAGTDGGWLASVNSQIAALRVQLT